MISRTLLALVLYVLLLSCIDSTDTKLQRFLLKGNEALIEGNSQQALYYFGESLKLDSCFVDALNNSGTIYFKQNRFPQALEFYSAVVNCKPDYLPVYFNRANTFYELKEYYSALKDLDKIKLSKPDTFPLHFTEGLIYTKLRNYNKAEESFTKASSLTTNNTEVLINLATLAYYKNELDKSKTLLQKAIQQNDSIPNAYNTLALVELAFNNTGEALKAVNQSLALDKDDAYALNNRGFIHLIENRLDAALEDINQSIFLDPSNAWAYRNKGIYYLKLKDYTNALRLFKQAKSMDDFVEDIDAYIEEAESATEKK